MPPSPAPSPTPSATPSVDERTARRVEEVWERHAAQAYALARRVSDEPDEILVRALLDACGAPYADRPVGRREMARYVFVLADRGQTPLARSSCAVALGAFGDHTYREIAVLMGLTDDEIAELLRCGLREAGTAV